MAAASLGIDAEPNETLPSEVLPSVTSAAERARLQLWAAADGEVPWDRLLFSCKEAVYKAWFGRAGRWLDFSDVEIDAYAGHFVATLLVPGPLPDQGPGVQLRGRWAVRHGLVVTTVLVRPDGHPMTA
ncbi:4'-phosphopantetheinyl transferase family protein [Modestobacter sp. SYSU DS0875]